jgi:hypothetical protein
MKGQKSLEMVIGLVILLVVAGTVISVFLNQFQGDPGGQYDTTLQQDRIENQCTSLCTEYKQARGTSKQTAAIEYCTSTFQLDSDGDGTLSEVSGRLYNSYCEDGVKCFNEHTCEIGREILDAPKCKEIMMDYYTSSKIGDTQEEARQRVSEWYVPNGEGDRTIGTCGLENVDYRTWYSENFETEGTDITDSSSTTTGDGSSTEYASAEDEWCQTNGNGRAYSAISDEVNAGCKQLNDLDPDFPADGKKYFGASNDIPCSDTAGYYCEE